MLQAFADGRPRTSISSPWEHVRQVSVAAAAIFFPVECAISRFGQFHGQPLQLPAKSDRF